MPVQTTYPGVYVQEVPSGIRTITGVSTSTALFIGRTVWGPINEPELCLSYPDFRRKFTDDSSKGELAKQVSNFFINGGSQCYILRIFKGADTFATGTLSDTTPNATIQIKAKYKGKIGQTLKVQIDYVNVVNNQSFNIQILRTIKKMVQGVLSDVDILLETWLGVSINPLTNNFIEKLVKSDWITFETPTANRPLDVETSLTGGATGGTPSANTYEGAFDIVRNKIDLFNLLILPKDADFDIFLSVVLAKASILCKEQRAFLISDPPDSWTDVQTASQDVSNLRAGLELDHAAVFYPKISSSPVGIDDYIGPSGTIAGLFSRTDSSRGVWKSPAGIDARMLAVLKVKHKLSDGENGILNPRGINVIRVFSNGIVNWGARTMDGDDDFASEWKYISVRRTALFIEESLFRGLKWVVFEPNDEPLWAQIRLNVTSFMDGLFKQGAFQGITRKEAYLVKCDRETTTQNDINLGRVNILVGFSPLKPAEFVMIQLTQLAGQSQV